VSFLANFRDVSSCTSEEVSLFQSYPFYFQGLTPAKAGERIAGKSRQVFSSASQGSGGPLYGYATERPAKRLRSFSQKLRYRFRIDMLGEIGQSERNTIEQTHVPMFRLPDFTARGQSPCELCETASNEARDLLLRWPHVLVKEPDDLHPAHEHRRDGGEFRLSLNTPTGSANDRPVSDAATCDPSQHENRRLERIEEEFHAIGMVSARAQPHDTPIQEVRIGFKNNVSDALRSDIER